MKRKELNAFYNEGFGWVCKSCHEKNSNTVDERSRLMTEGEAESKDPVLSNKSIAKWSNEERKSLICTTCKSEESLP